MRTDGGKVERDCGKMGAQARNRLFLQHHTPSIQELQATMTCLPVPRLILFRRLRIGEDQGVGQPSSKATRRTLKISAGGCLWCTTPFKKSNKGFPSGDDESKQHGICSSPIPVLPGVRRLQHQCNLFHGKVSVINNMLISLEYMRWGIRTK